MCKSAYRRVLHQQPSESAWNRCTGTTENCWRFYAGRLGFERLYIYANMESNDNDSTLCELLVEGLLGRGAWSICHHQPIKCGPLAPLEPSLVEEGRMFTSSPRFEAVLSELDSFLPQLIAKRKVHRFGILFAPV